MRYWGRGLLFIFLFASVLACTKSAEAPKLAPREQRVPVEACYRTDLDLRQLRASSVRNLITCLNGNEGSLQPYADFLEQSVSDEDLKVLLDVYNRHLVKESRFRKVFDFIDLLNQNNMSNDFYKNLTYLTQTRSLQTLLPVLGVLYEKEDNGKRPIDAINSYLRVFIENEELNKVVLSFAELLGSGRSRWATYMAAQYLNAYPKSAEAVVDEVSNAIYQSILTNGWQEFLVLLSDPVMHPIMLRLFEQEKGLEKYGHFFKKLFKEANQQSPFGALVDLSLGANKPTYCYNDDQYIESLFSSVFDKVSQANNENDFNYILGQEVPTMYFVGRQACNFDERIKKHLHSPIGLVRDGFGFAMFETLTTFQQSQREEYIKRLLTSVNVHGIESILQNFTHNDFIFYFLEIFEKDLTIDDYTSFHKIVRNMYIKDYESDTLEKWLPSINISAKSRLILNQISQDNKFSLHALLDHLIANINDSEKFEAYTEFLIYLSQIEMADTPGSQLQAMMLKLFGPNYTFRRNLKDFVNTYLESLSNQNAGWGDLMASIGEAIVLTSDDPFVDFIKDLISDEEFVAAMNPVLEKFFKDPLFLRALAFTGELAENGELRRLTNFFIQLAKNLDVPGLEIKPSPYSYTKYRGPLEYFKKDFSVDIPSPIDYTACWNLSQTNSADLWLDFINCTNANGSYPNFVESLLAFQEIPYKEGSLYSAFTHFIENIFSKLESLEFIKALSKVQSEVKSIHAFIAQVLSIHHKLLEGVDRILEVVALDPNFSQILLKLSKILSFEHSQEVLRDLLSKYEQGKAKYYDLPLTYHTKVTKIEELWEKVSKWKKIDLSDLPPEQQTRENLFYYHLENYVYRNQDYLYLNGVYSKPDDHLFDYYHDYFKRFVNDLLRPKNLEVLSGALKKDADFYEELLSWLVSETKVIEYYQGTKKDPTVRFVTNADQLEILVRNAQIGVASWAGSLGVDHIGTYFQYEIAVSDDLKQTLKKLRSKISQGKTYSSITGNRRKLNHLKNIEQTFAVLEEMEELGYLTFLQEIYSALLKVTPEDHQKLQDPDLNHMGLAHYLTETGFFVRMVHGLQILKENQQLDDFSKSLANILNKLDINSLALVRKVLLLTQEKPEVFTYIFTHLYNLLEKPQEGNEFKKSLLSITEIIPKTEASLSPVLALAEGIMNHPEALDLYLPIALEIASKSDSSLFATINTFSYINTKASSAFLSLMFFDEQSLLYETTKLLRLSSIKASAEVKSLYRSWSSMAADETIDFSVFRYDLLSLVSTEEGGRILNFASTLIGEPEQVDLVANVLFSVGRLQKTEEVFTDYLNFMRSGSFDSFFDYVNDFQPMLLSNGAQPLNR